MWIDSFKVKVDSSENNKLLNDTEFVLHRILFQLVSTELYRDGIYG